VRQNLAGVHLARLVHMTSNGSLARAFAEKRLELRSAGPEDDQVLEPLRALATEEKLLDEDARILATARGVAVHASAESYAWIRLKGASGRAALPRILRIYDREIFELAEFAREGTDDDVRSLLLAALDGRHSVRAALAALAPKATLPGAK
jgi:hypothetical protein